MGQSPTGIYQAPLGLLALGLGSLSNRRLHRLSPWTPRTAHSLAPPIGRNKIQTNTPKLKLSCEDLPIFEILFPTRSLGSPALHTPRLRTSDLAQPQETCRKH